MMSPQGLQVTSEIKDIDSLVRLSGRMECESPNRHLYEFVGNIRLDRDRWAPARPRQSLRSVAAWPVVSSLAGSTSRIAHLFII